MKGLITRKVANGFAVIVGEEEFFCQARGNIKLQAKMQAGDYVNVEKVADTYVITELYDRKNQLTRPYISNIDKLFIVLSEIPKPDFLLIDKMLIGCIVNNIEPILIINKVDILDNEFISMVKSEYEKAVKSILLTSAKEGVGIDEVKLEMKESLSAFTGQSAVGKTSLINAIFEGFNLKTNDVSKRINMGKNTTRETQIYKFDEDSYIADTPGFNMLNYYDMEPSDLKYYYEEFNDFNNDCKFKTCTHINVTEKDCAIKRALTNDLITLGRYQRYSDLYEKLLDGWKRRYD